MKIDVQIGSGVGIFDVARSILGNIGCGTQRVALLSRDVRDASEITRMIEVGLKVESDYVAKVSTVRHYIFYNFEVEYHGSKSVVSVTDDSSAVQHNDGFDVVHFLGCETFFDGLVGISVEGFLSMCAGAKKVVAYFSEPYVATPCCIEMLDGLRKLCGISFSYYPRKKVIDNEIVGDCGVCGKCNRRVLADRPEELCSEVHLKIPDGEGEDASSRNCVICARKYRVDDGWRLMVNHRCPYYAEHFVSEANNGM